MTLEENLNQPFIGSKRNIYYVQYYGEPAYRWNIEVYTSLKEAEKNALNYVRNFVPVGTSGCGAAIFKKGDRHSLKAWGVDIHGKIFPTSYYYQESWNLDLSDNE